MRVILKSDKAIRGFIGHYPWTAPGVVTAIAFDIQHGFANGKWFTSFAIQTHGTWHSKTIYQSDNQQTATVSSENGATVHIKTNRIDQHGADFELVAEFNITTHKGFIFKRKAKRRIRNDEIKIADGYTGNATIRRM